MSSAYHTTNQVASGQKATPRPMYSASPGTFKRLQPAPVAMITAGALTYNTIHRHQSKLVRTRVASNKSPWLSNVQPGDIFTVPISHGEGRLLADEALLRQLAENGQILTQYVDQNGNPTNDIQYNPNGSAFAIEGLLSPDGRVLGKMGHSERIADRLYQNVPGEFDMKLFKSAVEYWK